MSHLRYENIFKFFTVAIALYWTVIWINFITLYIPPPEAFKIPLVIQIAGRVLHVVCHASVIFVIHYLGRKKLFRFLCIQFGGFLLFSIGSTLAYLPVHYLILLVVNLILGLLYVSTLFSIRKTPFDHLFTGLAVSECILLFATYGNMFFSYPLQKILTLGWVVPATLLYLLVQKTRRHLAAEKLEAGFLEELQDEQR